VCRFAKGKKRKEKKKRKKRKKERKEKEVERVETEIREKREREESIWITKQKNDSRLPFSFPSVPSSKRRERGETIRITHNNERENKKTR